jgi:hypothetical protein
MVTAFIFDEITFNLKDKIMKYIHLPVWCILLVSGKPATEVSGLAL